MKGLVNKKRLSRCALYGGSFDPVHHAHLRVARYALEQAQLDRVVFVPAAQSPLKAHAPLTDAAVRVQMLSVALRGEAHFELDESEIERGGLSYTIDTVRHFSAGHPDTELYWIVGADQFEQLDRWYQIEELAERVTFLVLARPGSHSGASSLIPHLRYQMIKAPLMSDSSSEIRVRCREGRSLQGLVPSAVQAFIFEQELYSNLQ
tara:strand:- start:6509 stop:7126 length:618 start_codon:yes stop_codon:yes gene_type:complete